MKTIRVFPRRTKATPDDCDVYIGEPDLFAESDRIHISVAFTWDIPEAERLSKLWSDIAPVEIGGPAIGQRGENFIPGLYLKSGYVITSRGCPNRCWFCSVWRREGETIRELPITNGWNVLDDNLLACSEEHIRGVFSMLAHQPHPPEFTGGLEAKRLRLWHAVELKNIKPKQLFFAMDTDDDDERDALRDAGKLLLGQGFTRSGHVLRCYVLVGYPGDTFEKAEKRLRDCMSFGFLPMAMLYRDYTHGCEKDPQWSLFQRKWARPAIISKAYGSRAHA